MLIAELEKRNNFFIKMDKVKELYNQYIGKGWVRLITNNGNLIGKIKDANFERVLLSPQIIRETVGIKPDDNEVRLEEKIPTLITSGITGIEPLSENYILRLLETYPVKDLKKR